MAVRPGVHKLIGLALADIGTPCSVAGMRIPVQAGKQPGQRPGGPQQRVAIARALRMKSTTTLLDEPSSAPDPERAKAVLDTTIGLAEDGMTMRCLTHGMGFARSVAERVIFMAEGRIDEQAAPAKVFAQTEPPSGRPSWVRSSARRARRRPPDEA